MIRVMLVDDHALVRMGFRMLLAACEDLEVGWWNQGHIQFHVHSHSVVMI